MSAKRIAWTEHGRGLHRVRVAALGRRRVEVSPAPPMFGKWEVREWTGAYVPGHFKPEREMVRHAWANDFREAREKAGAVLRGEEVERAASEARYRRTFEPRGMYYKLEHARKGGS